MLLKSIIYQREEFGPLLRGWFVGKKSAYPTGEEGCLLDENYQPIPKDIEVNGEKRCVLRVHEDLKMPVQISIPGLSIDTKKNK